MDKRCLYCYQELPDHHTGEYHERCARKFFGSKEAPVLPYPLDHMAELAKNVVERSITVPGVQPKLSMSLVKDTLGNNQAGRLTVVGMLGGNYILKPPSGHFQEMPQNEHLTMRMAAVFGIPTVMSTLIRLQSGELSYLTKRIDRLNKGGKVHMLDMFQITEAFDKYKSSMEKVAGALGSYSDNQLLDLLRLFDLTVFCFLTGNSDMHLKNFSMILANGQWLMAPAYDLLNVAIVMPEDTEELALTLEGKKRKLKRIHFENFAKRLGLNDKQVRGVFNRFYKRKAEAIRLIEQSFLSAGQQEAYKELLHERYAVLWPE